VTRADSKTAFSPAFAAAISAIDAANAEDPNSLDSAGESRPKELVHAELATRWVHALQPDPSEALLLAARAHHLRRWRLPRSEYPEGRAGYHRWRTELQERHARGAGELLRAAGYTDAMVQRVGDIIRKRALARDPEVQTLEDALCLVFLETQFAAFAARHPEEKVVDILRKSLKKMSGQGREAANSLAFSATERRLLARALEALSAGN
jgi:hypothetical protein